MDVQEFLILLIVFNFAQVFEKTKTKMLEKFISKNGAFHYELPLNSQKIKLRKIKKPIKFPDTLAINNSAVKVFKPNFDVFWQLES